MVRKEMDLYEACRLDLIISIFNHVLYWFKCEGIVGDETGTIPLMCFMNPFLVYFGNKLGEITSMLEDKDREEEPEEE